MWSSGYGSCLPYRWVLVRSAAVRVLSNICKSLSVVEILFYPLSFGEREFLRATALNRNFVRSDKSFVAEIQCADRQRLTNEVVE